MPIAVKSKSKLTLTKIKENGFANIGLFLCIFRY